MQLIRTPRLAPAPEAGFTLVELLVTLVVVSIGMLGLAKLQAAALVESQVSRTRSIMAYQAEALAGAMRADRSFWASTTGTLPSVSVPNGGSVSLTAPFDSGGGASSGCTSYCSPAQMAYADVTSWATSFGSQFPTATATVGCSTASGPTSCDITLSWTERFVAINKATAAASAASSSGTLVVHVQP